MNSGNHIVDSADKEEWLYRHDKKQEPEEELVKCDNCGKDMDAHRHYSNGGYCFKCLSMSIGGL